MTWSSLSPPTSPPGIAGGAAAWDSADSTIVVFGGRFADGQLSDQTWVWNGSTWSEPTLYGASPPERQLASMAFDTAVDPAQLILFGGRGADGALLDDTWTWNGSSWNQVPTTSTPGGREGAAMTVDRSGQLVLFGGYGTTTDPPPPTTTTTPTTASTPTTPTTPATTTTTAPSTSTTTTTPSTTTTTTAPAPTTTTTTAVSGTDGSAVAPAPGATTTVAAGSSLVDPTAQLATTSASSTTTTPGTTPGTTPAPDRSPPTSPALATGPQSDTPRVLDDTWVLSQSAAGTDQWEQVATSTHPPPATDASMATGASGQTLLFGGTGLEPGDDQTAGTTAATWLWNGRSWSSTDLRTAPAARQDATLDYDADIGAIVLFGGLGANGTLGDTWLWTGSVWERATPATPPSARSGEAAAYDPVSLQLVAFGGANPAGTALSSTEVLSTHAPTKVPIPASTPSTAVTPRHAGSTPTTVADRSTSTSGSSSPTSGPSTDPPGAGASITVYRGGAVTLSGAGFVPHAKITITFHSIAVTIGSTHANAAGDFETNVEVPDGAILGDHHFEASGMGPHGLISLFRPVQVVKLVTRHGTSTATMLILLGIAAAIPLLSWAGLDIAGRRRRPVAG